MCYEQCVDPNIEVSNLYSSDFSTLSPLIPFEHDGAICCQTELWIVELGND